MATTFPNGFVWGAATSAYQVEGAHDADGKGRSVWDVYTNDLNLAGGATGNVAIDQYHRYESDVQHLKSLGIQSYRFSLAWTRLFPDGTGPLNPLGVRYYDRLIDELLKANIRPAITLFHWDLPLALADRGGWRNRESVEWFTSYAEAAFKAFGDRVDTWITFNEPYIDRMVIGPFIDRAARGEPLYPDILHPPGQVLAQQATETHHWLLAHAAAVEAYRQHGCKGNIGISLSLTPTYPETSSPEDQKAALIEDGIHNRWFLDPVLAGKYPDDMYALYQSVSDFAATEADMEKISAHRADFVGVNYYSCARVRATPDSDRFGVELLGNPDEKPAFNGEVYPEGLTDLLIRIDRDYNHPTIYITENGAGFGDEDDTIVDGRIKDTLRQSYLERHIMAAHNAVEAGVDLQRYYVWSCFDNLEWVFGYKNRFGIIHVDFETQTRTPKDSALMFKDCIRNNGL